MLYDSFIRVSKIVLTWCRNFPTDFGSFCRPYCQISGIYSDSNILMAFMVVIIMILFFRRIFLRNCDAFISINWKCVLISCSTMFLLASCMLESSCYVRIISEFFKCFFFIILNFFQTNHHVEYGAVSMNLILIF